MNYRSIADLSHIIRSNLYKLPNDLDLVVGIPRSGMLAANVVALNLNLNFCDLHSFINDIPLKHGEIRSPRHDIVKPSEAQHILVVDDSIDSGKSLAIVRNKLIQLKDRNKISFCSIYATQNSKENVDIFFEICMQPRVFEWNVMHRPCLLNYCVDIDGVLCIDPTEEQNDDGPAYLDFLANAVPLVIPSYAIGHLVTSRLEKYRQETEKWLIDNGVVYKKLHMLDLPDAETRRRLRCHGAFKAEVFKKERETTLFIESDPIQAQEIAIKSGKYVLSFSTQELFDPNFNYVRVEHEARNLAKRVVGKAHRVMKRLIKN